MRVNLLLGLLGRLFLLGFFHRHEVSPPFGVIVILDASTAQGF